MSERAGVATAAPPVAWPPDDTEESVVGTNLHQESIATLKFGLNEAASHLALPGDLWPWRAYMQTTITGWQHSDGSPYTTLPDIYVYPQTLDLSRPSLALAQDGPPLLIVEVLSPTTYKADLDLVHGKGYCYARAGVYEYLALDVTGEFSGYQPQEGRAWRLEKGRYRPWRPNRRGHWQSDTLGITIELHGVQVVVSGPKGFRMWREGEVSRAIARRDAELARQNEALARQNEALARQNEALARQNAELEVLRCRLKELGQQ